MAQYTITRSGAYLRCSEAGGDVRMFINPSVRLSSNAAYPTQSGPFVEIVHGSSLLQLAATDIVSIDGVSYANLGGTLVAALNALTNCPVANGTATTSATGATAVALTSQACSAVTVINTTGSPIDIIAGTLSVSIPAGSAYTVGGLTNASTVTVRRTDQSNTQLTLAYRWVA